MGAVAFTQRDSEPSAPQFPHQVALDEDEKVYSETIWGYLASYKSLVFIVSFLVLDVCACCYYQVGLHCP